jgi:hypothetical protein
MIHSAHDFAFTNMARYTIAKFDCRPRHLWHLQHATGIRHDVREAGFARAIGDSADASCSPDRTFRCWLHPLGAHIAPPRGPKAHQATACARHTGCGCCQLVGCAGSASWPDQTVLWYSGRHTARGPQPHGSGGNWAQYYTDMHDLGSEVGAAHEALLVEEQHKRQPPHHRLHHQHQHTYTLDPAIATATACSGTSSYQDTCHRRQLQAGTLATPIPGEGPGFTSTLQTASFDQVLTDSSSCLIVTAQLALRFSFTKGTCWNNSTVPVGQVRL